MTDVNNLSLRELILDASSWKTRDDVYDSFFRPVGAPSWRDRYYDALRDSLATGQTNEIEVPSHLVIRSREANAGAAKEMRGDFVDLVHELGAVGYPVEVRLDDKNQGARIGGRS